MSTYAWQDSTVGPYSTLREDGLVIGYVGEADGYWQVRYKGSLIAIKPTKDSAQSELTAYIAELALTRGNQMIAPEKCDVCNEEIDGQSLRCKSCDRLHCKKCLKKDAHYNVDAETEGDPVHWVDKSRLDTCNFCDETPAFMLLECPCNAVDCDRVLFVIANPQMKEFNGKLCPIVYLPMSQIPGLVTALMAKYCDFIKRDNA